MNHVTYSLQIWPCFAKWSALWIFQSCWGPLYFQWNLPVGNFWDSTAPPGIEWDGSSAFAGDRWVLVCNPESAGHRDILWRAVDAGIQHLQASARILCPSRTVCRVNRLPQYHIETVAGGHCLLLLLSCFPWTRWTRLVTLLFKNALWGQVGKHRAAAAAQRARPWANRKAKNAGHPALLRQAHICAVVSRGGKPCPIALPSYC